MAIPSQEIGYGTEEKLLWQISKQLESLTGATYNSKKTLLNVASGTDAGSKIETFSGAYTGESGDTIFTIDLDQVSGAILEYYAYSPYSGTGSTGTCWIGGSQDGGKYANRSSSGEYNNSDSNVNPIGISTDGTLVSINVYLGSTGELMQIVYTVKLFTSSLYNA